MSILDGLKNLVRPYDDDMYDDDFAAIDEFGDEAEPAVRTEPVTSTYTPSVPTVSAPSFTTSTMDNRMSDMSFASKAQTVVLKPRSYSERTEIANHIGQKRTVIVNTELISAEVSIRLMDFLSGVTYANSGDMQKVSESTFVIAPSKVEIPSEVAEKIKNDEFHV